VPDTAPGLADTLAELAYSHPPLIDVNWFHETSSISASLVNEPNFNIGFAVHCKAHNFTNVIQKLAKCDENSEYW
jgi:hypothetical protein